MRVRRAAPWLLVFALCLGWNALDVLGGAPVSRAHLADAEWRRWTRQLYADSGLRLLVRSSGARPRPVDAPRGPGEDRG